MAGAVEKLVEKLGFDPARRVSGDASVLADVVKEIQEERTKEAKVKVKELLVKAIEVRRQIDDAKKKFDKEVQKFEKELGKVLGDLERLASGKPAEEATEVPAEEAPAS
jgi:hypothetical protein